MISPPEGSREFLPGDHVRVIDGYFQSYKGVVESVDLIAQCAVVTIDVFGRPQPVELSFEDFERTPDEND